MAAKLTSVKATEEWWGSQSNFSIRLISPSTVEMSFASAAGAQVLNIELPLTELPKIQTEIAKMLGEAVTRRRQPKDL